MDKTSVRAWVGDRVLSVTNPMKLHVRPPPTLSHTIRISYIFAHTIAYIMGMSVRLGSRQLVPRLWYKLAERQHMWWLLRPCDCISSVWIERAVCLCRVPRYPRVLVHDNLCQSKALPFIVASISCWRVRLLDSFNLQSNWIVKLRNQLKLCSHQ